VVGVTALAGCTSTHGPDADPAGLFPATYRDPGDTGQAETLLRATAAKPGTTSYTFEADVPAGQAFDLVARCASGALDVGNKSTHATGRCHGGARGVVGLCAGGHFTFTVSVSKPQPGRWGLALYRTPPCSD
jgi:hypothetical protein